MSHRMFQIAFAISLLIILIISWQVYYTFEGHQEDVHWVEHSEQVRIEVENLTNYPVNYSNELRRAVILRDSLDFPIDSLEKATEYHYQLLDSLISDNLDQQRLLNDLTQLVNEHITICKKTAAYLTPGQRLTGTVLSLIEEEAHALDNLSGKADEMIRAEQKLLLDRIQIRQDSSNQTPITLLILILSSLGSIGFLFLRAMRLQHKNKVANEELAQKVDVLRSEIEYRESFQRLLKSVLDASNNSIMAFDPIRDESGAITDFKIKLANSSTVRVTGRSIEEMTNGTLLTTFPGNKAGGLFDEYVSVMKSGKETHFIKFYDYDRMNFWFDIAVIKNGEGLVVSLHDITSLKKHEGVLIEKQQELADTIHQLEQFTYIASHDLQEPLRKVRAFGDRLHKQYADVLEGSGLDYISRMQNASERMQILIEDLLKFSRVSRSEQNFQTVDLNTVLSDVLIALEFEIERKKAKIQSVTLPVIDADEGQMRQLFQNLISNSLKYSKKDTNPEVSISVSSEIIKNSKNKSEEFWKISVSDNGIGFASTYKKQIFVIFKRLHGRSEYSGTGIGLAICERIVHRHNGIIEAHAEQGNGATFNIFLPKHL